ncbi:eCIS core domain-containing protein [Methanosarcina sp.]|uniref:eCIS core domain-containing protein n=1 Tax=Methanosarcina sp. TaxID=2213 RepID=UPI003BB65F95
MAEKVGISAKKSEAKQKCLNSCKQNVSFNSSGSTADRMLQIQRTAGNKAVQRLIKSGALQAKLRVSQPNDIYEQEANRVVEQVMSMPDPQVQRQADEKCESEMGANACNSLHEVATSVQTDSSELGMQHKQKNATSVETDEKITLRDHINKQWIYEYDGCSVPKTVEMFFDLPSKDNPAGGVDTDFSNSKRTGACDKHDECYQTCGLKKDECDTQFYLNMMDTCKRSSENDFTKNKCRQWAKYYFQGVRIWGKKSFGERRSKVCKLKPASRPLRYQNPPCDKLKRKNGEYFKWLDYIILTGDPNNPLSNFKVFTKQDDFLSYIYTCSHLSFDEQKREEVQRKYSKYHKEEKKVLQTKESLGKALVTMSQDVLPIVYEVLRSSGQPLDSATRNFMDSRFGYDFSGVRVHTDAKAAEAAHAVNARAFTVGRDIFFGTSQYAPGKRQGKRLLAHELTHVIQQGTGSQFSPQVQRVVDWRKSYQQCCSETFFGRTTLSWGNKQIPPLYAINLMLAVTATESKGYGPEDLATVWAIESNFTFHPSNNLNPNGSVDVGPAQINYQAHSEGMSQRQKNSIFGTNLKGGETFNGNPESNLKYAWKYLQKHGHSGYNPGSKRRQAAIAKLLPELKTFFRCILNARTITFSESEV